MIELLEKDNVPYIVVNSNIYFWKTNIVIGNEYSVIIPAKYYKTYRKYVKFKKEGRRHYGYRVLSKKEELEFKRLKHTFEEDLRTDDGAIYKKKDMDFKLLFFA